MQLLLSSKQDVSPKNIKSLFLANSNAYSSLTSRYFFFYVFKSFLLSNISYFLFSLSLFVILSFFYISTTERSSFNIIFALLKRLAESGTL